jgi:hypothetical protein
MSNSECHLQLITFVGCGVQLLQGACMTFNDATDAIAIQHTATDAAMSMRDKFGSLSSYCKTLLL